MGDPDGFEAFFQQHRDSVVRALTLVFGERAAAEDAAQVGFERAFARWHRVGTYERPATWVYVVALRHGRRQRRPMEGPHGARDDPSGDHAQASVDRIAVIEQVMLLPPQQRAVIVLRMWRCAMRVEDLEQALRTAAERQPPVRCDVGAVQAGGRRRQRTRALWFSMAGVGALAMLGVSLVVWTGGTDNDHEVRTSNGGAATGQWEELPAPPLSPRARVVGVWTGSEVLFVGGDTWLCPPTAGCLAPEDPPLADGAILDPATEIWRSIASAPVPFSYASTAVLGEDVFFLIDGGAGVEGTRAAFLKYSLADDEWEELPLPPGEPFSGLVAAGDLLVAVSGSDERGEVPDQVYDPSDGAWSTLPADPLSPSFDRSMVWADPYLYLFDKQLVAQPGSDGPSITRAARLVPGTDDWVRLPDSEIISSSPWYAEGNLLVNPQLGGADGGGNSYGRTYPNGGILNTDTQTWSELPAAPSDRSAGVVGKDGGLIFGGHHGLVLDVASMTWIEMPAIPGADTDSNVNYTVVSAGRDAVAFGGQDWSGPSGQLLGDAWIWRTADPASSNPVALCPATSVEFSAQADASVYQSGDVVVIDVTAANHAGRDCYDADSRSFEATNSAGETVHNVKAIAVKPAGSPPWRPGEVRTEQLRWEQGDGAGDQVPPDRYVATITWSATDGDGQVEKYQASVTFDIV